MSLCPRVITKSASVGLLLVLYVQFDLKRNVFGDSVENANVFDFNLTSDDMSKLDGLDRGSGGKLYFLKYERRG
jgi:hypothetical protein